MLSNITIRARLVGALIALFALTAGLGGFSYLRFQAMNGSTQYLAGNALPSTRILGRLATNFEALRARQMAYLLSGDERRVQSLKRLMTVKADIEKDFLEYAPLVSDGEQESWKAVRTSISSYVGMGDEYLRKVQSGDDKGAKDYLLDGMLPTLNVARAAVKAELDFNDTAAKKAGTDAVQLAENGRSVILVVLAVLAALTACICWVSVATISMPVRRMAGVMKTVAQGDTAVDVPHVGERSEIGEMAAAVEVFRENLIRTRRLEAETAEARLAAEEQRRTGMRQMADGFEAAVGGIIAMVSSSSTELQATAQAMTATATETASQSTTVAAAADQAASNVKTVAAAAEELGSSVQEIGRQVDGSAELARTAVSEADRTGELVRQLSAAVARIGDVVGLISSIASQTNLLALNATIEAARAGEAGRGFAVVAAEVKELAGQTARATQDISTQIASIQDTTGNAVAAIGAITGRIQEISGVATSIAAAVEQQGAATQEIVRNVAQAALGTGEVTGNIAGVADAAEQTGAAATQVLGAASELSRQSEHLAAEVARFLGTVRAA